MGLRWTFAALMLVTTAYHLWRLVAPRLRAPGNPDVDVTHAGMGIAMVIMLVGSLSTGSSRMLAFAAAIPTAWFGWRALRSYVLYDARTFGHNLRQALVSVAMLYLLVAGSSSSTAMAGMPMDFSSRQLLDALLVLAVLGAAVSSVRPLRQLARPNLAAGCQLAMNVTTVYMLAVML
jgi:hypothetical protein